MISAKLKVKMKRKAASSIVNFIINKKLNVTSLSCSNLNSYKILSKNKFPFCEEGNTLNLNFLKPITNISFDIEYILNTSKIGTWGVNKITYQYTELGLYTPWYPYIPNKNVVYNLEILTKNNYQVTSIGQMKMKNGKILLKSNHSQKSILLFSAKKLFTEKLDQGSANIKISYFSKSHKDFAKLISRYSNNILEYFNSILPPLVSKKNFDIIIANRDKGGSYARNNSIIIQYVDDYESKKSKLFKSLAHEIAHLWW